MNITPLYNLRLRLKNAMIQGTNLLSEDFRLKRANFPMYLSGIRTQRNVSLKISALRQRKVKPWHSSVQPAAVRVPLST